MDAHPSDVLVIEHEADCPPGLLAEVLSHAGLTMHLRRPYRGDQLPPDLSTFEGLVVLGGAMGARDDAEHPWLPQTRRLLALAVDRHLPTLGICLGAQLAASALEGRTGRREQPLVGLTSITLTDEGREDPVLGAAAYPRLSTNGAEMADEAKRAGGAEESGGVTVLSWNQDTVTDLPPHSTLLARDADGGIAGFRTGTSLWAVQFHPEVTAQVVGTWARTSQLTPAGTAPETIAATFTDAPHVTAAGTALLEAFAQQVRTD